MYYIDDWGVIYDDSDKEYQSLDAFKQVVEELNADEKVYNEFISEHRDVLNNYEAATKRLDAAIAAIEKQLRLTSTLVNFGVSYTGARHFVSETGAGIPLKSAEEFAKVAPISIEMASEYFEAKAEHDAITPQAKAVKSAAIDEKHAARKAVKAQYKEIYPLPENFKIDGPWATLEEAQMSQIYRYIY